MSALQSVFELSSWRLNVYYELTLVHKTPVLYYTTHLRREMMLISQLKESSISFIQTCCYMLSLLLLQNKYISREATMPGQRRQEYCDLRFSHTSRVKQRMLENGSIKYEWLNALFVVVFLYPSFVFSSDLLTHRCCSAWDNKMQPFYYGEMR